MTNGLRNHPGPTKITSWEDERRYERIHRRFWIVYTIALTCAGIALYYC